MWRTPPNYDLFGALLACGLCLALLGTNTYAPRPPVAYCIHAPAAPCIPARVAAQDTLP